ncbi:MAG: hypothetical protein HY216_06975 [Candidatus Rokubacteria bacterium]|nr:hypothetical protein [Candidatus Rokubacteria bacterium]
MPLVLLLVLAVATAAAGDSAAVGEFVARHWRRPLAPQGVPPARFSALERSLQPESCGTCHAVQFADWRTSIHAASMGPGIAGQLVEMAPREARGCYVCHAPLAEQAPYVPAPGGGVTPNRLFDRALHARGVPCAGCHVRNHQRFGPPRRDGSVDDRAPRAPLPHGGVTRTPAFLASEFCAGCHQFAPGGFAVNGKLVQDTYEEWKASRFARDGVQCQDCHMPDRRHLWRGIHDAEMVRGGLAIDAHVDGGPYRVGDVATVVLSVTSVGVGHAFPTYVTPRVILRVELVDAAGAVVPGTAEETVIARDVTLDLARENFDTRLAPGATAELRYRRRVDAAGLRARARVVVEPDAFYTRFFDALLTQGAGRGEAQIREARASARRSPFTVFTRDVPLT